MATQVVFIDDEPDIVELYEELFDAEGVQVTTFTEPALAIAHFEQQSVDLCFIDYRMPGMSGIELRQQLPEGPRYFLITGELDMLCPEGFEEKFAKPLDFAAIEQILGII